MTCASLLKASFVVGRDTAIFTPCTPIVWSGASWTPPPDFGVSVTLEDPGKDTGDGGEVEVVPSAGPLVLGAHKVSGPL